MWLRSHSPLVARTVALVVLVAGVVLAALSYYRLRNHRPFRMRSEAAELSSKVVSVVDNYERRETQGDRTRMLLRAAHDVAYVDGHHVLQDVNLELYPETGAGYDQVTARECTYDNEKSLVTFNGDVKVETRDHLIANSGSAVYDLKNQDGQFPGALTFERENIHGQAASAFMASHGRKLDLRGDVSITVDAKEELPQRESNSVRNLPIVMNSRQASFDQTSHQIVFTGGATIAQGHDLMSGDTVNADLAGQNRLQHVTTHGQAYLRSMEEGHTAEIHSTQMDFYFDDNQRLQKAIAVTQVSARTLDSDSELVVEHTVNLEADFDAKQATSVLTQLKAAGRPVITFSAPKSQSENPRASNKRLTADDVKLFWRTSGRDLERFEATGSAELVAMPVKQIPSADRKTLQAPRFDCDFYDSGNLARLFKATEGATVIIDPILKTASRTTRTLTSQQMTAVFDRETQDLDRFDAQGNAKFNEGDKYMQAQNATYTTSDDMVRLRGGEPVVWDSRGRTKARELDSDLDKNVSYGRGQVATTYYSQEQTGGAAPFSKVKSPVFLVAEKSEFHHDTGVGIYTGSARMWQDDNFVRADQITLKRDEKRMEGEGNVQSALYQAHGRDQTGARTVVPVFVTAGRMFYEDPRRLVHYEVNVDIRQGTDRMTGQKADVFLEENKNEVDHMVAEHNVVLTEPGRRGTGQWAQYIAATQTVVLTGSPARVDDSEQGTSEGPRVTVYMDEKRVVSDKAEEASSTSRVHTIHHVRKH